MLVVVFVVYFVGVFFLMIRRPPRSTRTDHTLSLHDALPIWARRGCGSRPGPSLRHSPGCAAAARCGRRGCARSEEHTSELQSLMRISYAVFCLKKKKISTYPTSLLMP